MMRAAVYHGRRDVRVQDWPEPPPPGPGEVRIEVSLASVCGTDADEYATGPHLIPLTAPHPGSGRTGPLVLGHEMVGRIVAVGAEAGQFAVGDRVVPGSGVSCGRCRRCSEGRTNLCASYYTVGLHADGGLAEQVNLPAAVCRPVGELPDEVAILAQPLAVALHAVHGLGAGPGTSVVVLGAGGIGSLMIAALAVAGVEVMVVDLAPARLDTARRLGAACVVDASTQDAVSAVRRWAGAEGADAVVECSGAVPALRTAAAVVRRGGFLQLVGLHRDPTPLDLTRLVLDEITLATSKVHVVDRDLPAALALLAAHPEIATESVGAPIALEDLVPLGLEPMADGSAARKVIVKP